MTRRADYSSVNAFHVLDRLDKIFLESLRCWPDANPLGAGKPSGFPGRYFYAFHAAKYARRQRRFCHLHFAIPRRMLVAKPTRNLGECLCPPSHPPPPKPPCPTMSLSSVRALPACTCCTGCAIRE